MGRYTLQDFVRAIRNPECFRNELYRLRWDARRRALDINQWYHQSVRGRPDAGVRVMERDWDTLLILDACRYDMYAERSTLNGNRERVLSRGSQSGEFMEANFLNGRFHDTVYVTANPHSYDIPNGTFHAVEFLLEDCWDDASRTVLPETVVQRTLDALEAYPNKRLLVHFMQPHFPFLGPTGEHFEHLGIELHLEESERSHAANPWEELMFGTRFDEETVIQAYRENYDIVLDHVADLVAALSGKIALTSDHGNLLGERTYPVPLSTYGHPPGIYKRELLEVPWVEFGTADTRRKVTADPPVEAEGITAETVEQRLNDLGYHA